MFGFGESKELKQINLMAGIVNKLVEAFAAGEALNNTLSRRDDGVSNESYFAIIQGITDGVCRKHGAGGGVDLNTKVLCTHLGRSHDGKQVFAIMNSLAGQRFYADRRLLASGATDGIFAGGEVLQEMQRLSRLVLGTEKNTGR